MIRPLVSEHWAALALAILVGALLLFPSLWMRFSLNVGFDDPMNIRIADEFYYFARIKDVLDGHPLSGNPFTGAERAELPGQPVFLGEYLAAQAVRLTGLPVVAGSALLDGILPVLAVLLAYACLLAATGRRSFALVGTALLFFWFFPGDFARTVSPQVNFLFWLAEFLLLFPLLTRDPGPRRYFPLSLAAAVNLGLLAYVYTYYWTFWLAFLGIALVAAAVLRDWPRAKYILVVLAGGSVVAAPYLVMISRALGRPEYIETVRRIGMIDSHFPSGIAIIVPALVLLAASAFLAWRGSLQPDRRLLFFAIGALAAVASVNQHVITGKNLEFSSHYFLLSVFWFVFFAAYLMVRLTAVLPPRRMGFAAASIALVLTAYGVSEGMTPAITAERAELRRYMPVLAWMEASVEPEASVLASAELSNLIPIYTSANVFFSPWLRIAFLSDDEVLDRFAIATRGEVWMPDAAVRTVYGVQFLDSALHTRQENRVRRIFGLPEEPVVLLPQHAVTAIEERRARVTREWPRPLERYRVDYAVFDRHGGAGGAPDPALAGRIVYDSGDFVVYRLR